jgi:hypothetical protein
VLIKDIFERTIKPDGTIVELKPEDVFERDIIKGNGVKLKAKSFAVPAIETGAIIEYRWKEIREDTYNYTRIELAREIPVQFVKYYIRPAKVPVGMRLHSFNTSGNFVQEDGGFYSTTMKNVPAFREEPRMRSEYDIKPWSEEDEIIFELPAGYSLESADSPKAIKIEKYGGSHETKIFESNDKKNLTYQRKFSFGKPDSLLIYDTNYQTAKSIFELFYTADSHTLILREDSSKTN